MEAEHVLAQTAKTVPRGQLYFIYCEHYYSSSNALSQRFRATKAAVTVPETQQQ